MAVRRKGGARLEIIEGGGGKDEPGRLPRVADIEKKWNLLLKE